MADRRKDRRLGLQKMFDDYVERLQADFTTGAEQSAQGLGDIVERGNVLTGIPRLALGGLGWMGSPVSAAVSPVLGPLLAPVAEATDSYVGQPVERLTGYPADLTNEIFLSTAIPFAGAKVGKMASPYLSRLADAAETGANRAGYTFRPQAGTFFSGGGPIKLADDVAEGGKGASVGGMSRKLEDFDDVSFPNEMGIPDTVDTIEQIAKAAGLRVKRGASERSDSEYVTLSRADDPDGVYDDVKIRVSDHDLPSYYGESTYDVGTHGGGIEGGWVAALDEAFADLGVTPPALSVERAKFLNSGPEWKRQLFEKKFETARARSNISAKKKGQPED